MSNQYIEAICTMPKEIAFGYDAYSNLSLWQKGKVNTGVVRPESTVEYRWHYAKEAAYRMNKLSLSGKPKSGLIMSVLNEAKGASTQFSLPPTSNKSVWYQGAIALQALAIYYKNESLRSAARVLYNTGDNTPFSSSIGKIQSAAKNVYRKSAKAMEKAGLSSSEPQVRFITRTLQDYAKISEIVFGKNLSVQSSTDLTPFNVYDLSVINKIIPIGLSSNRKLSDNQRRAAALEEAKKVKKARGLDVKASVKIPFKTKAEGNLFRAWVNDNHKSWAKANDLSRSGSYDNSYIKKAWKRWGQDYQMAMAQKAFMERKTDDIPVTPAGPTTVAPKPVSAPIPIINEPLPFDDDSMDSDPFADEDPEVGMIALLQDDPEEFLKQYWYVPVGGFVGIIGLALGIRVLTK